MCIDRQRVAFFIAALVAATGTLAAPAGAPVSAQPGAAQLPPPASPETTKTADELTRLQDRTVLLQAQLKELEAQQAVTLRMQALSGSRPPSLDNVRVISVERIGRTQLATIQVGDGSQFEVTPGEQLDDGTRVVAIDGSEVTLQARGAAPVRMRVVGESRDALAGSAGRAGRGAGGPLPGQLE